MLAFISNLRVRISLRQRWAMLYEKSYDDDGVMHPRIVADFEI